MKRYTTEQLLQSLRDFYQSHNRVPKHYELVTSRECFRRRFGSLQQALIQAGLPVTIQTTNERVCEHCKLEFLSITISQRFCSRKCAATVTNKIRKLNTKRKQYKCICCDVPTFYRLFCSQICRSQHTTNLFSQGLCRDRITIKRQLIKERGERCQECSLSSWRDHPLPLEVDHVDGDASNNAPVNVRLVCPNCHSITSTWKGRNKGNGRKSRGLSTH